MMSGMDGAAVLVSPPSPPWEQNRNKDRHSQSHGRARTPKSCSPDSLYRLSLATVAAQGVGLRLGLLSEAMRMDTCQEMLRQGNLRQLANELSQLDRFFPLLSVGDRRTDLHRLFQAIVDSGNHLHVSLCEQLLARMEVRDARGEQGTNANRDHRQLLECANLASFFGDAGWYDVSCRVYSALIKRVDGLVMSGRREEKEEEDNFVDRDLSTLGPLLAVKAEATVKLLTSYSSYCQFLAAEVRLFIGNFERFVDA